MSSAQYDYEENFCEFEEGDIYAEGFGLVASLVMRDKSISAMAKLIYAYLMTFSNRSGAAWPSTNRILEELDLSRNSFYKYRSELRDAGFLDWTTFGREGGGRRTVYKIFRIRKTKKEFSTNPRSEQYPKICAIASEDADKHVEMWKTNGGKPTNSANFGTTNSAHFGTSTYNRPYTTNQTTTNQPVDNPRLEHGGTAIAEPVVAAANASGSTEKEIKGNNEEKSLDRDSIDAAFTELEARSLRRTKAASSLAAAKASYRRLVREGHSPEEISDVYDHYLRWVKANAVQHPMGLAAWFERDDGWKLNHTALMSKRAAAKKATQTHSQGVMQDPETDRQADLEYRKRSAAVKRALPDSDAECAYMMAYAESSDDQRLRDISALIRREKPVQYSNGYVDDRLSKRPSYDVLVRLAHSKKHIREYTTATYAALVAEGKKRG